MSRPDDDTPVQRPSQPRPPALLASERTTAPGTRSAGSTGNAGNANTANAASFGGTVTSPGDALRHDEMRRTRRLLPAMLPIGVAVWIALPFLGGNPRLKLAVYAASAAGLGGVLMLFRAARDAETYTALRIAIGWLLAGTAVCVSVAYFGVFSPAPILMLFAIYLIALGHRRGLALTVYGLCAGFLGLMVGLIVSGTVADPGLVRAGYLSVRDQLIGQGLVQVVLGVTFIAARQARKSTMESLLQLEQAVRGIAQREAMLQEARQDLDRAIRIGEAGPHTDRRLGSYVLEHIIGRGAMGEVYQARHADSGAAAAVKLVHPGARDKAAYTERFLREVQAARALDSEHVVKVLEVGGEGAAVPYIAMERLAGHDLGYYLRTKRRLSPARVLELVDQVGQGIECAAEAGIVHRDIKPQNLFWAEPPTGKGSPMWKILDFGVSKLGGQGGTLTQGNVLGTPGYMAPEQAQSKDVDSRADLYSLSAIAYRALTGLPPFRGKDVPTTLYNVVYHMPPRPSALTGLPEDLDAVLAVAMAKNPDDRFFRAHELSEALAAALRGELDPVWRERGRELARHKPWGTHP